MAKWARLYRAYGIPVYAVFDSDTDKNEREATDSLNSAEEVLQALGAPPGREVTPASITVTKRYACLDTNYETALRSSFPGYADLEAEGGTLLGKSKQLRARHAARNVSSPPGCSHTRAAITPTGKTPRDELHRVSNRRPMDRLSARSTSECEVSETCR